MRFEVLETRLALTTLTVVTHGRHHDSEDVAWVGQLATAVAEGTDPSTGPHYALPYTWIDASDALLLNLRHSWNVFDPQDWGAANEDRVAGELYSQVLARLEQYDAPTDIHLIGFSRGAAVVAEVARRLDAFNEADPERYGHEVGTIQITTLDPQKLGADGPLRVPCVVVEGGAARNYYQTKSFITGQERIGSACPHPDWKASIQNININGDIPADRFTVAEDHHGAVRKWYQDWVEHWQTRVADGKYSIRPYFASPFRRAGIVSGAMTVSIGQSHAMYFDAARQVQSYEVRALLTGNLVIEATGLVQPFNGTVELYSNSGQRLGVETNGGANGNLRLIYRGANEGQLYRVVILGGALNQGTYLKITQPATIGNDPADHVPPPPVSGDDFPDDKTLARLLNLDSRGNASIRARIETVGDSDWFKFTARKTGKLVIEIQKPNSSLDSHLRLHNDGVLLAQHNDRIERNVTAGETFWLQVRAGSEVGPDDIRPGEDPTGKYLLKISQPVDTPGGSGTDTEPEPTTWGPEEAVKINLVSGNGSSRWSIDSPADVRWFEIRNAQTGNMLVTVQPVNDDFKTPFVTAFRANGGGIDTDSGESDQIAEIGFPVAAGEVIWVAVSSDQWRSTGGFTISVSQPTNLPNDDHPDFGETPRDMSGQVSAEGHGNIGGRIQTADDNDWLKIPLRGTGLVFVEVQSDNSSLVPFLELSHDATSGGFFESDDGRDGRARIWFVPESGASFVWAKVSSVDGTQGKYTLNVWRGDNPNDDHPDRGGAYAPERAIPPSGALIIPGRIEHPGDGDAFRFLASRPGPVKIEVIPLTEGFFPKLGARWQTPNHQGNSDSDFGSGRGGRSHLNINNVMAGPDNWINVGIGAGNGPVRTGDYLLYIWEPKSAADMDADTVGPEASLIMLDGTGNGTLPGAPNGIEEAPAINHAGDVDVFQFRAAKTGPVTIIATEQFTFLRVYDAAGNPIATDHGSEAGGSSLISIDVQKGDLLYVEFSANDGTTTGSYSVQIQQPMDDHPDASIFIPRESQTRDATAIGLDPEGRGQATGEIETVGDRDVFQVYSAARSRFVIDVQTTDDMLDSFVRVYDSHGDLIGIDDDGGDIRNSHVEFNSFQNDVYTVEVSGYADNSIGHYEVRVQVSPDVGPTLVGVYDNFNDSNLDLWKWSSSTNGTGAVQETGGQLRLSAQGNGATVDNNSATIVSRATVAGDVDFEFTATVPNGDPALTGNVVELSDGTNYLGFELVPDGAGGITLRVRASGYDQLENLGRLSLVQGSAHHAKFAQVSGDVHLLLDGAIIARFAGPLRANSSLRSSVLAERKLAYDDFNDNSIDQSKWTPSGSSGYVVETGGKLRVYVKKSGSSGNGRIVSDAAGISGAKWDASWTGGASDNMTSFVGITNGTDYIRFFYNSHWNSWTLQTGGAYGNASPYTTGTTDSINAEIRQENGNIRVLVNGVVVHTIANKSVVANSILQCINQDQGGGVSGGEKYFSLDNVFLYGAGPALAEMLLDNVQGTFVLPADSVAQLYDDFEGGSIDFGKWQIAGLVRVVTPGDGNRVLQSALFRAGQPVSGFASTAGMPGGTDLRGFRLGSNRSTTPKTISGWDTNAYVELTNGTDYLRIRWTMARNSFTFETGGAYGIHVYEEFVVSDEIPDGPLEIRERDDVIEFLHNGQVRLSVPGTVRAGSYFQFVTDGDPEAHGNVSLPGGPDYDAYIDHLEFYVDRPASTLVVDPALDESSDSGLSDTDHVINHLSPSFEWLARPAGTMYQWREGELLPDGTIAYGDWSPPQAETDTTVILPHGSVHVFSVRPIGTDGIVGQESARGIVVDTVSPTIVDIAVRGSNWALGVPSYSVLPVPPFTLPWIGLDQVSVRFSEDVGAETASLALRGAVTEEYGITDFTYDSSNFTGIWTLGAAISIDKLLVNIGGIEAGLTDVAGNLVDAGARFYRFDVLPGDVDGNGGVNFGDYLQTRAAVGKVAGTPGFEQRFDIDGNGGINFGDSLLTRAAVGNVLPTGEPEPPVPHTNPVVSLDVDGSGTVTPVDALLIINELLIYGSHDLALVASRARQAAPYLDVNGDGSITNLDALRVINQLLLQSSDTAADFQVANARQSRIQPMSIVVASTNSTDLRNTSNAGRTISLPPAVATRTLDVAQPILEAGRKVNCSKRTWASRVDAVYRTGGSIEDDLEFHLILTS